MISQLKIARAYLSTGWMCDCRTQELQPAYDVELLITRARRTRIKLTLASAARPAAIHGRFSAAATPLRPTAINHLAVLAAIAAVTKLGKFPGGGGLPPQTHVGGWG